MHLHLHLHLHVVCAGTQGEYAITCPVAASLDWNSHRARPFLVLAELINLVIICAVDDEMIKVFWPRFQIKLKNDFDLPTKQRKTALPNMSDFFPGVGRIRARPLRSETTLAHPTKEESIYAKSSINLLFIDRRSSLFFISCQM